MPLLYSHEISSNAVTRLHHYRKSLYRLKQMGFLRVFSENLADSVSVTASQVRRDFSAFGLSGNKRGGYNIDALIGSIDEKLGKDQLQKVIVVGAGNVGRALTNYKGFAQEGIAVVAVFDADEAKVDRGAAIPVLPMSELTPYVRKNHIEVAVIAVPDIHAQKVLDELAAAKIRGVLNFAPIRLIPHGDVVINHVDLGLELETVVYHVKLKGKKAAKA